MVSISFEINGKKVDPKNIANVIESAFLKHVESSLKSAVGSIRCREHAQSPRILAKGRGLKDLTFEVFGCCDAVINEVKMKLK